MGGAQDLEAYELARIFLMPCNILLDASQKQLIDGFGTGPEIHGNQAYLPLQSLKTFSYELFDCYLTL